MVLIFVLFFGLLPLSISASPSSRSPQSNLEELKVEPQVAPTITVLLALAKAWAVRVVTGFIAGVSDTAVLTEALHQGKTCAEITTIVLSNGLAEAARRGTGFARRSFTIPIVNKTITLEISLADLIAKFTGKTLREAMADWLQNRSLYIEIQNEIDRRCNEIAPTVTILKREINKILNKVRQRLNNELVDFIIEHLVFLETDPPIAPSGLKLDFEPGFRGTKVRLSWEDNSNNELGFLIERRDKRSARFRERGKVEKDETKFTDLIFRFPKSHYCYRVIAFNFAGGSNSEEQCTDVPRDTTPPSLVTDFQASDNEDSQSTLTWTNPSDSDLSQVIVKRKTTGYPANHDDGETRLTIDSATPGRAESFVDTGLTNGTTYYYAVFSRDNAGNWNDQVIEGQNADTGRPQVSITAELWGEDSASNLLRIDPNTGAGTLIGPIGFSGVTDIAFTPDGLLLGVTFDRLLRIDPNTGQGTAVGPSGFCIGIDGVNALTSRADGTLFAATKGGFFSPSQLITIDRTTGCATIVGSLEFSPSGDLDFAFAPDGRLFAVGGGNPDTLYVVDPDTGASTLIGPIGFTSVFGLAFFPDGTLYGASSVGPKLLKINTVTGAGTEVGTITNTNGSLWGLAARIVPPSSSSGPSILRELPNIILERLGQGFRFLMKDSTIKDFSLSIFDLRGQLVFHTGWVENGFEWGLLNDRGQRLANGVYLYVVWVRGFDGSVIRSEVKKLVVLR